MANWLLDGIIEIIQKSYHQMKFTTEKGFSTHLPHVMLTNKATQFAQTEYNHLSSKAEKDEKRINLLDDLDPSNNHSKTAINCREKEHLAITNYLNFLEVTIKKGRKFCKNAEHNPDNENGTRSHVDLSVQLDAANIACDNEDKNDDDDEEVDDLDDSNLQQEAVSDDILVATTQRPLKIQIGNVNNLCFKEINLASRTIIVHRNPKVTRFNYQEQLKRKMGFYRKVHANLDSNKDGSGFPCCSSVMKRICQNLYYIIQITDLLLMVHHIITFVVCIHDSLVQVEQMFN